VIVPEKDPVVPKGKALTLGASTDECFERGCRGEINHWRGKLNSAVWKRGGSAIPKTRILQVILFKRTA